MMKYFSCLTVIFLLHLQNPASAQDHHDSAMVEASADTTLPAGIDTNNTPNTDTVSAAGISVQVYGDSLYQPITDSGFFATDSSRIVPHKQVLAYTMNPDYEYANDPRYWKKEPPQKPGVLFKLFANRIFLWTLFMGIILLVLYGIYLLARENNFSWLYRSGKHNRGGVSGTVQHEEMDFDPLIQKYESEQDYRMAVRYMYLRLIYTAREKSIVQIRDSSTNAEIAGAFRNDRQRNEFRFLAGAYDYIFYGGFIPEQELFSRIKNRFESFQQNIVH